MNTTDPTADFDGCNRRCRLKGAHTLVWGDCEHATAPEPTVSLSRVFTDTDGLPAIGFDSYTVPQLAELITAGLRASDLPVDADAFVDIASVAAHAIVHRNDEPAASTVLPEPTSRAASEDAVDRLAEWLWDNCAEDERSGLLADDPRRIATVALHWPELRRLAAEAQPDLPTPGPYRHYKGGEYDVIATARHTDTGQPLVVYQSAAGWWCRPADDFAATVTVDGVIRPRFRPVTAGAEQQERSDVGTEFVRQIDQPDEAGLAAVEADVAGAQQQPDTEAPASTAPLAAGLPLVKGNCPACRRAALFLGTGGYPTCSNSECPEPDAATTVLEQYANEAHPPSHAWKVESPRRDNWASWGTTYDERDWALERYESALEHASTRPFRLVRETTTYTVEAEHTPPAPVEPATANSSAPLWGEETRCVCGHLPGIHTGAVRFCAVPVCDCTSYAPPASPPV